MQVIFPRFFCNENILDLVIFHSFIIVILFLYDFPRPNTEITHFRAILLNRV